MQIAAIKTADIDRRYRLSGPPRPLRPVRCGGGTAACALTLTCATTATTRATLPRTTTPATRWCASPSTPRTPPTTTSRRATSNQVTAGS
eukprot:8019451-Pyramimonas_sp.AAC.1